MMFHKPGRATSEIFLPQKTGCVAAAGSKIISWPAHLKQFNHCSTPAWTQHSSALGL